MRVRRLPVIRGGVLLATLALAGCVAPGANAPQQAAIDSGPNDPWENTNRSIFGFNQKVDENVLVPVAEGYRQVVPPPVRQSVHDFMQNLNEPVIFANDVLQGQGQLAGNTFGRLALNTTIGVGGLFDVATPIGIPYHSNDFGVTLANWGFPDGPYLILPVLGPSNVRDLAGKIGDGAADPGNIVASNYHYLWATVARAATEGIDLRSRNIETLNDIQKTSLDYYATIRSLYQQRRAAEIRHEGTNLPNPSPFGGGDSGSSEPSMSYSVAPPVPPQGPPR